MWKQYQMNFQMRSSRLYLRCWCSDYVILLIYLFSVEEKVVIDFSSGLFSSFGPNLLTSKGKLLKILVTSATTDVRWAERDPALLAYSTTKFLAESTVISLSVLFDFYYLWIQAVLSIDWFAWKSLISLECSLLLWVGGKVRAISLKLWTLSGKGYLREDDFTEEAVALVDFLLDFSHLLRELFHHLFEGFEHLSFWCV